MLVADEAADLLGIDAVQEGQWLRVVGVDEAVEDLLGLGTSQTLLQELAGHIDTALAHLGLGSGVHGELVEDPAHLVDGQSRERGHRRHEVDDLLLAHDAQNLGGPSAVKLGQDHRGLL